MKNFTWTQKPVKFLCVLRVEWDGDQRIAALLSDLEPILVELSHAGKTLSPDELASIQKRIDSKNLLFKVRVMSAQGGGGDVPPPVNPKSNSL